MIRPTRSGCWHLWAIERIDFACRWTQRRPQRQEPALCLQLQHKGGVRLWRQRTCVELEIGAAGRFVRIIESARSHDIAIQESCVSSYFENGRYDDLRDHRFTGVAYKPVNQTQKFSLTNSRRLLSLPTEAPGARDRLRQVPTWNPRDSYLPEIGPGRSINKDRGSQPDWLAR